MATKDGKYISKYTVEYTIAIHVRADSKEETLIKTGRRLSKIESDRAMLEDGIEYYVINKQASKQI